LTAVTLRRNILIIEGQQLTKVIKMRALSEILRASGVSEAENGNICNKVVMESKRLQRQGLTAMDAMQVAALKIAKVQII
jgi:hypothetical protein